jgi:hypothetical protein
VIGEHTGGLSYDNLSATASPAFPRGSDGVENFGFLPIVSINLEPVVGLDQCVRDFDRLDPASDEAGKTAPFPGPSLDLRATFSGAAAMLLNRSN